MARLHHGQQLLLIGGVEVGDGKLTAAHAQIHVGTRHLGLQGHNHGAVFRRCQPHVFLCLTNLPGHLAEDINLPTQVRPGVEIRCCGALSGAAVGAPRDALAGVSGGYSNLREPCAAGLAGLAARYGDAAAGSGGVAVVSLRKGNKGVQRGVAEVAPPCLVGCRGGGHDTGVLQAVGRPCGTRQCYRPGIAALRGQHSRKGDKNY